MSDWPGLRRAIEKSLQTVDLNRKRMDFEHLLFDRDSSRRVLHFPDFVAMQPAWVGRRCGA